MKRLATFIFIFICILSISSHGEHVSDYWYEDVVASIDTLNKDLFKVKLQNQMEMTHLKQLYAIILTVIILFVIAIVIAGILYRQRMVQQKINKLLLLKNEHIRFQAEEIQVQAEEVTKLNEDLECLNQNLENEIRSRTRMLRDQNNLLAEYAFSNAHELRAPVASVIGLVNLLNRSRLAEDEKEIIEHLSKSAGELALVVKDIQIKLERNDVLFFDDNG